MKFIERDTLHICGYLVETDAAQNADDLSKLYKNFFDSDKESVLLNLHGSKKGFYGLMWYTQGHAKYCYLLGIEVGGECEPPDDAVLKTIPKTTYAVACYPHDKDAVEAWSEFFFTDIPKEGYVPDEQLNLYFEYFPESVDGDYELWVPVVKSGGVTMENTFTAKIERFEMQGGWYYVPVPMELSKPLEYLAIHFGFIAIIAKVGNSCWPTSLLPKGDGTHFIALPAKVRTKEKLSLGAEIEISFETRSRKSK